MTKHFIKHYLLIVLMTTFFGLFAVNSTFALTYSLPSSGNVIGSYQKIRANGGETLLSIAQRYDIGVNEILSHNRGYRLSQPLPSGTSITIPSSFVLPSGPRQGIVLNLAQMRIYHFRGSQVDTYPVGIGRQGWSTPRGNTSVVGKKMNPTWRPTASIHREALRRGKRLPAAIPPGPRNPLGRFAMYLGFRGILIHGTIAPGSIGTRSSHGCIRMFNHNIQKLFNGTAIGTPIRIVSEGR